MLILITRHVSTIYSTYFIYSFLNRYKRRAFHQNIFSKFGVLLGKVNQCNDENIEQYFEIFSHIWVHAVGRSWFQPFQSPRFSPIVSNNIFPHRVLLDVSAVYRVESEDEQPFKSRAWAVRVLWLHEWSHSLPDHHFEEAAAAGHFQRYPENDRRTWVFLSAFKYKISTGWFLRNVEGKRGSLREGREAARHPFQVQRSLVEPSDRSTRTFPYVWTDLRFIARPALDGLLDLSLWRFLVNRSER